MANFTIKIHRIHTEPDGTFTINPEVEGGYNVMPQLYETTTMGHFANVLDIGGIGSMNAIFTHLLVDKGLSLDEIHRSPGTRLHGMMQFVATDASGNPLDNYDAFILLIVWE